jgi:hypothetical protein
VSDRLLGVFSPGDEVAYTVVSYMGIRGAPMTSLEPQVRRAKVLEPVRRSPNAYEKFEDGRIWFFLADLPVSVSARIDAIMHLEFDVEYREIFHLKEDHWSVWRHVWQNEQEGQSYWATAYVFPEKKDG